MKFDARHTLFPFCFAIDQLSKIAAIAWAFFIIVVSLHVQAGKLPHANNFALYLIGWTPLIAVVLAMVGVTAGYYRNKFRPPGFDLF